MKSFLLEEIRCIRASRSRDDIDGLRACIIVLLFTLAIVGSQAFVKHLTTEIL